jgi:hypothetical protein
MTFQDSSKFPDVKTPKNGKTFIDEPKKSSAKSRTESQPGSNLKLSNCRIEHNVDSSGKEETTLNKGRDIVVLQRTKVH